MAVDRCIFWTKERPTREQLQFVLEDFFSGIGTVEWVEDQSRWYVTLPGQVRHALARVAHETIQRLAEWQLANPWKRWIEVFVADDHIDVMTRQHDQITNALAAGFHELVKGFWEGTEDPPEGGA